jgi:tRNA dimethylallyltransferase
VEEAVRRTRTFARRQAAWFRRDPRIAWMAAPLAPVDQLDRALGAHDPPP